MNATIAVGDKVRMQTSHSDGSLITYTVTVRKIDADLAWVEIPSRVRNLQFAPHDGKRFAQFRISDLMPGLIQN